jgi:hypothetical protein
LKWKCAFILEASAGVRVAKNGSDLRKDLTDGVGDWGEGRASGNGHKAGHESVLDEILPKGIAPDPEPVN